MSLNDRTTTPHDPPASGLSETEAKEVHSLFQTSFLVFVGVALFAHLMAWLWRPWLPGEQGYASLDPVATAGALVTMLS